MYPATLYEKRFEKVELTKKCHMAGPSSSFFFRTMYQKPLLSETLVLAIVNSSTTYN
jgi:hypothetical protein